MNMEYQGHFNLKKIVSAMCLSLALVASQLAFANSLDPDTTVDTGISGYPGNDNDSFFLRLSEGYGVTEIAWEELNDRPCFITIDGKDPAHGSETTHSTESDCGGKSRIDSRKTVRFKNNPRYFVRGVAVCSNNKKNHRMKGVKIYAAELPSGTSSVEKVSATFSKDHANCRNWHTPVFCPSGKVAHGLNVEFSDGSIVGLGLHCQGRQ